MGSVVGLFCADVVRLGASYLSVCECYALRKYNAEFAVIIRDRDWLRMLGAESWRLIDRSWPKPIAAAMHRFLVNPSSGAALTGSTVLAAFFSPDPLAPTKTPPQMPPVIVSKTKIKEMPPVSVSETKIQEMPPVIEVEGKSGGDVWTGVGDCDIVLPLSEAGLSAFMQFFEELKPHVWNVRKQFHEDPIFPYSEDCHYIAEQIWRWCPRTTGQEAELEPQVETPWPWRRIEEDESPEEQFKRQMIDAYCKHLPAVCVQLFLTEKTGTDCVCREGKVHGGPLRTYTNRFPNCPSIHRQIDVIFLTMPSNTQTEEKVGNKRKRDPTSEVVGNGNVETLARRGVWEWVSRNFDFDICANVVFLDGSETFCLVPDQIVSRTAIFRDRQYCQTIDIPRYQDAVNNLELKPMLDQDYSWIRDQTEDEKRWSQNERVRYGEEITSYLGHKSGYGTNSICNCTQIVPYRIDKYLKRGFKITCQTETPPEAPPKRSKWNTRSSFVSVLRRL